jgi:hypothetical protein
MKKLENQYLSNGLMFCAAAAIVGGGSRRMAGTGQC